MIKAELINRVSEVEIEGTDRELVCEAVSSFKAVYHAVDDMNKYILICMLKDSIEELNNDEED